MDEIPQTSSDAPVGDAPPTLEYALAAGGAKCAIASFPDSVEADIVALVLEGQGIRASVEESRSVLDFGRRPGTLLVRESDAAIAIELLASTPARKRLTVPEGDLPPARVLKIDTCPKCESAMVRSRNVLPRVALVALALLWIPLVFNYGISIYAGLICGWIVLVLQSPGWRCKACGHRWTHAK